MPCPVNCDSPEVEGKYARAEALYRRALEISRRVLGPEHTASLYALSEFASILLFEVTPPTGEPEAGDPHVRFGGRGS